VAIIDSKAPFAGANEFNLAPVVGKVTLKVCDIADKEVAPLVEGADYIFNLAGALNHTESMRNPLSDLHANCAAHVSFLELLRKSAPSARVLYAGTRGQYGAPKYLPVDESHPMRSTDANGINKIAGEAYHLLYAKHYDLHACSIRLSNTYGPRHVMTNPGQGVLNWFIRKNLDGEPIELFGGGGQKRDIHFVDDVVDAMLLALASPHTKGEAYNLGGEAMSLKAFAEAVVRLAGKGRVQVRAYPPSFKAVEIGDYQADYSKAEKTFGWKPATPLEEGLNRTLRYYEQYRSYYW
jgi:nucleoside-diphosphate-sugar epimerase